MSIEMQTIRNQAENEYQQIRLVKPENPRYSKIDIIDKILLSGIVATIPNTYIGYQEYIRDRNNYYNNCKSWFIDNPEKDVCGFEKSGPYPKFGLSMSQQIWLIFMLKKSVEYLGHLCYKKYKSYRGHP